MKTKKILFAGHSDDIVYVREDGQSTKEFNVDSDLSPAAVFLITNGNADQANAMLVFAHYDEQGCWYFGVGRLAEGMALPPWRVAIGTDDELWNGYTAVLIVEVPEDADLTRFDYEEQPEQAQEPTLSVVQ
jgi:hypothetical protein